MSELTIRGHVRLLQVEVRDTSDLLPDRAAEILNRLSGLLGNVVDEIREADMAYNVVYLTYLESEKAANRAKVRAETTQEYRRKREAHDLKELAVTLIQSLKYFIRTKQEEYRYAGHQ